MDKAPDAMRATRARRPKRKIAAAPLGILLVEDDEATRLVSSTVLSQAGYHVVATDSGRTALAAVTEFQPDIVVVDVSLPGIDGIETSKRLRSVLRKSDLPVVAMSAHVFKTDVDRYLDAGVDAFVAKPIDHEQLLDTVALLTSSAGKSMPPAFDAAAWKIDLKNIGHEALARLHLISLESLPRRFQAMRDAVEADDRKTLRDLAHATQSTAGSLGFPRLLGYAEALEAFAAHGSQQELSRMVRLCEVAFNEGSELWQTTASEHDPAVVAFEGG